MLDISVALDFLENLSVLPVPSRRGDDVCDDDFFTRGDELRDSEGSGTVILVGGNCNQLFEIRKGFWSSPALKGATEEAPLAFALAVL